MSGVRVEVYTATTSSTTMLRIWTTEANGSYTVTGLAPGTYFVRTLGDTDPASTIDVLHELHGGVICHRLAPPRDCPIATGTPVTVTAGAVTASVDFLLDKASTISGTVVADVAGTPLSGVTVTAYIGDTVMGSAKTNTSGQYTIHGLRADRYRVRTDATPANYVDEWQNGLRIGCPGARATLTLGAADAATG